jgi:hypothetical protein
VVLLLTFSVFIFLHFWGNQSVEPAAGNSTDGQIRLLLGVVTLWDKIERRHLIRQLYPLSLANSSAPIARDVVRTIFVVGEPETDIARAILEWESKTYGDIMILEGVKENMNSGKTFHFLKAMHDWRLLYRHEGWTHVGKIDDDTW